MTEVAEFDREGREAYMLTLRSRQVADLAMLVQRLSRFAPPRQASEAIDYLKREQLLGSVMRAGKSGGTVE